MHPFSFTVAGAERIWKVVAEATGQLLGIEVRDDQTRSVSFLLIDPATALPVSPLFRPEGLTDDAWWCTLEGVCQDTWLIGFSQPEEQVIRRYLWGVEVKTGRVRWQKADMVVRYCMPDRVVAASAAPEAGTLSVPASELICIDPETGEIRTGPIPEGGLYTNVAYPVVYYKESQWYELLTTFLNQKGIGSPSGPVEYLEYAEGFAVVVPSFSQKIWMQHLYMFDLRGALLLSSPLSESTSGIGTQTFIRIGSRLVWIAYSHTLNSIDLTES